MNRSDPGPPGPLFDLSDPKIQRRITAERRRLRKEQARIRRLSVQAHGPRGLTGPAMFVTLQAIAEARYNGETFNPARIRERSRIFMAASDAFLRRRPARQIRPVMQRAAAPGHTPSGRTASHRASTTERDDGSSDPDPGDPDPDAHPPAARRGDRHAGDYLGDVLEGLIGGAA